MRERLKVRRIVRVCVGIAAVLVASATTANAAIVETFSTAQSPFPGGATNQGVISFNYQDGVLFPPQRGSYYVSEESRGSGDRSWFTFDLRSSCTATDVTLQLVRGSEFGKGDLAGGDYTIHEVTTPPEVIYATPGPFPYDPYAVFNDLGDGPVFGGGGYPLDGAPSDVLSSRLNAAGVAAFNAARGDFFTLGMTGGRGTYIDPGLPPERNTIFGVSDPAKLVVTCALPSKKADCKNGGWRNYSVFKNQGDCVGFVATGGKNPPAKKPG
jgi:hypothetical protein